MRHSATPQQESNDGLLKLFDASLLSVVFLAPLFMGGRGPLGKFVFALCVGLAGLTWAARQWRTQHAVWRWTGVELLLGGGVLIVIAQLIPLPGSILSVLSPSTAELLPLWAEGSQAFSLGRWTTVSLDPEATRSGLVVLLSYVLLFFLVAQRITRLTDIERILNWIAVAAIAMATLGLAQFLLGNGKFLWVFEHPTRDTYLKVKGAFHNQNHFAHFLALGIGPLVWSLWKSPAKSARKHVFAIGLGIVAVAGLLTFSRGGLVAMAVAAATCIGAFATWKLIGKRSLIAAGAMGIVVAVAIGIHGFEPLAARLTALRESRSLEQVSHGRIALWSALAEAIPNFLPLGAGVGSHRNVYPTYMQEYFDVEFTHGENGYLPLLLETGVPGLVLMLVGIGVCFYWSLRVCALRTAGVGHGGRTASSAAANAAMSAAIVSAFVASVVHSIGDFVWYISACMSLTVILAACACRLYQLAAHPAQENQLEGTAVADTRGWERWLPLHGTTPLGRPQTLAIMGILAATVLLMLVQQQRPAFASPAWNRYLKIALANDRVELLSDENEAEKRQQLHAMSVHLQQAVSRDPFGPRPNLRLAANCLRQFEIEQRHSKNPMPLAMIRDAALGAQFPSKQAQDEWLGRAIGKNRELLDRALYHCRVALRGCPLQGEGYVYLAELSFLEGPQPEAKRQLVDQAQRVRPYSGIVLYAAGQEAAMAGDLDAAVQHWKQAFHQDPDIQSLIIDTFAPVVPAQFFLDAFNPDTAGLATVYHHYRDTNRRDDAKFAGLRYLSGLQKEVELATPDDASNIWYRAHAVYAYLEDHQRACGCVERSVQLDASSFLKRRAYATALMNVDRFEDAVEQFQWCARRKPEDEDLNRLLVDARRRSLGRQATVPTDRR